MRKILILAGMFSILLTSTGVPQVKADWLAVPSNDEFTGEVICLPDVYLTEPHSCLLAGPSSVLTQMAKDGIIYPAPSLPVSKPSLSLNEVPYKYAKIVSPSAPLYGSLALADSHSATYQLAGATRYISYSYIQDTDYGRYFQSSSGMWLDGGDVARAAPPSFQGVIVHSTPKTQFGWILTPGKPRTSPGFSAPEIKREVLQGEIYAISATKQVGDTNWIMIGLGEWIEDRIIGRVVPTTVPPEGVTNGRWIDINLAEQSLTVYEDNRMVFATLVSTGADPFFTQPGLFKIYQKKDKETMSGDFSGDRSGYYYLEDVPWTMYFDKLRAIHGAYWHARFGYDASHGCVNLSIGDSRWVYDWAKVGDYVYAYDPTGKTPTDPAFYTHGGA
ncbi:MAG: L,D-transpeptidase [Leptolinea sp.]|nr:L,D-transpeptidase [Leptolinea sp.]